MSDWRRHAIYFAPARGSALARFGARWLGRDPETGAALDGPDLPGLPRPRADLVAAPRRYGFHATLKAPFRLADGHDEAELDAATASVAADCRSLELRLRLDALGSFLALTPSAPSQALATLEHACVTRLDAFRAPPTTGGTRPPPRRRPRRDGSRSPEDLGLPLRARPLPLPHDPDRPAAAARSIGHPRRPRARARPAPRRSDPRPRDLPLRRGPGAETSGSSAAIRWRRPNPDRTARAARGPRAARPRT